MHRNPALYESIKAYTIAAIDLVKRNPDERCSPSDSPTLKFIFSHSKLKQLTEYAECQVLLQSDSIISSQFETLLGVDSYRHVSLGIDTIMVRLPILGIYRNELKFSIKQFERQYKYFEASFYDENIAYEAIVPLTGTLLNNPVKLSDNLEICLVAKDDLSPAFSEDQEFRPNALMWAVRAQYTLPKVLGENREIDLVSKKINEKLRDDVNALIDSVIACLRLFNISNVSSIANIHRTTSFIFQHSRQFATRSAPNTDYNLVFDRDISLEFIEFWTNFQAAVDHYKPLDLAVRRYSFTYERHTNEDQIIDLLIAAEALFLSYPKNLHSITSRLVERASYFLGGDDDSLRNYVNKDFRSAYKLRSMIVHGNIGLDKEIKKIEAKETSLYGEDFKLQQYISRIRSYIQSAITKMISIAKDKRNVGKGDQILIDLDNSIRDLKAKMQFKA